MILGDLVQILMKGLFRREQTVPVTPAPPIEHLPAAPVIPPRAVSAAPAFLPKYSPPDKDAVPSFFSPLFWGTSDDEAVANDVKALTAKLAQGYYFGDNLLTWARNLSLLDDGPFMAAWAGNAESDSDRAIAWRRYVLACAAYHCVHLEGDFVECGAYTGVGIKTVVDYLGGTAFPKTFWGYDLFEHDNSMLNHSMPEHGDGLYKRVREKFESYPQVRIIKGRIPEVFADGCPERIAYLHIDLNQAPAEIASLEYLFHRMVPGGILILDDYEWSGAYRRQKLAEDAWFDERQYRVMPLPTGQGLVIKR
jgi:O-methyltransferase